MHWLPYAGWIPTLHSVKESSLPWCFAWKSPHVSPHHSPEAADFALAANTWCLYSSSLQNAVSHDRLLLGLDGSPTPGRGVQQHLYPVHMLRPYDQSFIPGIVLCRGPEQVRWGAGLTRACSAKKPSWRNLPARTAEHWFLLPIPVNQRALELGHHLEGMPELGPTRGCLQEEQITGGAFSVRWVASCLSPGTTSSFHLCGSRCLLST